MARMFLIVAVSAILAADLSNGEPTSARYGVPGSGGYLGGRGGYIGGSNDADSSGYARRAGGYSNFARLGGYSGSRNGGYASGAGGYSVGAGRPNGVNGPLEGHSSTAAQQGYAGNFGAYLHNGVNEIGNDGYQG